MGLFKSIGKVFKKVLKTAIKVAPYALAAGAVVMTAGAALGVGAAAGGWGAAASGMAARLGMSPMLTNILAGSLTQAGYGAAVGGLIGGKAGLKSGAAVGALTGGATGLLSPSNIDPLKGLWNEPTQAATTVGQPTNLVPGQGAVGQPTQTGLLVPSPGTPAGGMTAATNISQAPATDGGTQSGIWKWMNDNPTAAGLAAQGIGSGLQAAAGGGDEGLARDEAQRDAYANNYKLEAPPATSAGPPATGLLSPAERFSPTYGFEYRWNSDTKRIEKVPKQGFA